MKEKEKEYVTWEDVEKAVNCIADQYKDVGVSGVYGIPRGGVILAVMLSHAMNVPLLFAPYDNCIIVDDICDSGESLIHYFKNSSGGGKKAYHIVTLYYKENDLHVIPDFFLRRKTDSWIIFPWERKD